MDLQIIHAFAGVGGVSAVYFGWQIIQSILRWMANSREAKAMFALDAEHEHERQIRDSIMAEVREALERKALPPPSTEPGAG